MVHFKYSLICFLLLLLPLTALTQSIKDVRINEIQVFNSDGFRDDYGQATSWIELYNKGYGKVNVASCILKVNGNEYEIPKGDPATIIPARGYIVFFAGGNPDKGTFHTNFTLDDTDFVELWDMDGKLINRFPFNPAEMQENVSYGWFEEDDGKERLRHLPATTPGSNNNTIKKVSRAEVFKEADPTGVVLTVTNIAVVAIALTLLFFIFKYMGNFHTRASTRKSKKIIINKGGSVLEVREKTKKAVTNDELAVIAIALFQYSKSLYEHEAMTLTIGKVSRVYSPWSSKIYGLRQMPGRKW